MVPTRKLPPLLSPGIVNFKSALSTINFRVDSEPTGAVTGTLTLSYEDAYGEYYEEEIPLSTTIEEKLAPVDPSASGPENAATRFPRWIFYTAGGAVLLAISSLFIIRWHKQKNIREEDEKRL